MATSGVSLIGVNIADPDTSRQFTLGQRDTTPEGYVLRYVGVGANVTANMACIMNETGYVQPLTTTLATELSGDSGSLFVVANQTMNTTQFGWVVEQGPNLTITCLSSVAADSQLYTTTTAGSLDDASAGVKINGVVCNNGTGAAAAGNYACNVWNPTIALQAALA